VVERASERDAGSDGPVKVGIVSNWNQVCGVAEYANCLRTELSKEFEVLPFDNPQQTVGMDVVVVNWHPAVTDLSPQAVTEMKSRGQKVIIVMHNSHEGYYCATEQHPTFYADATVTHQPMTGTVHMVHIPFGIPVVEELRAPGEVVYVGIAGFPYAWKRFNLVAEVARRLSGTALLIAPQHRAGDTTTPIGDIQRAYKNVVVLRDWLPMEEVVRSLSGCTLNVCWYQHMPPDDLVGQSGSVLLSVAARRPLIVSRHPKLAHVAKYEDEIYVAETEAEVHDMALGIVERLRHGLPVKMPNRILEEMGWPKSGERYRELIRSVA
jgi:hypothetical protein